MKVKGVTPLTAARHSSHNISQSKILLARKSTMPVMTMSVDRFQNEYASIHSAGLSVDMMNLHDSGILLASRKVSC